jgi:DNA-binding NarL/FixJ family response regulator
VSDPPGLQRRFSILVADDHPVVRYGLARLLDDQPDFKVVGEAESCEELCILAADLQPDIVVMDLEMDDASGSDAVRRLRAQSPDGHIVVFTAHDEEDLVLEVLQLHVQGYVKKASSHECICAAVRTVTHGGLYLDPAVAPKVAGHLTSLHTRRARSSKIGLTPSELTVLERIAAGDRNKDIAERLSISERAVKYHASSVFAKLGVENRTQAVEAAVRQGLIRWD